MSLLNNPENDVLKVTNHIGDKGVLKIYNRLGTTLKQIEIENETSRIDISDIPIGSYFITMFTGSLSKTMRFIKN